MNFFERQQSARGTTLKLVLLFAVAVVAIVAAIDAVVVVVVRPSTAGAAIAPVVVATALTLLVITGGMISKTVALHAGGSAVAMSVGAVAVDPTTSDPQLRRFVNIVEEMALASGVPMPRLFVLEQEPGINAFAAGYAPADAAITVTGGALHQLNRDELQGVIGHEFSHILNGDMRLNIRLIGLLNGILLLGLIGLRVLAFGGGGRGRRDDGGAPILVIALALLVLGFVGQFFASIIKAAVSRQREWLADASAVQFTRQTTGLEGALKKIAGVPTGSELKDQRSAREVSHMLFGEGGRFSGLFATHPPLDKRISALDPSFRPADVAELQQRWAGTSPNGMAEDSSRGLVGSAAAPVASPAAPATSVALAPHEVAARVGTVSQDDLSRGAALSARIPAEFRRLAGQPSTAVPLVLALLLDDDPAVRGRQLAAVSGRLGADVAAATDQIARELPQLEPLLRLPVVSLALPALSARPRQDVAVIGAALDELVLADGAISVFEYALTRLIGSYLTDAARPAARSSLGTDALARVQDAALTLLAVVAAAGNASPSEAAAAFGAAAAHLTGGAAPYAPPPQLAPALDPGWQRLDRLAPADKQRLVEAIVVAVRHDGVLSANEAELLRTSCALLHCPLPSFVA